MPKMAIHLFHLHFQITHRRAGRRAPIHEVLTPIDQALLVQPHKSLLHRLTQALIQGEALTLPINGVAQTTQLANDAAATLCFPLPGPLKKSLTTQVVACLAFLFELLLKDALNSNRSVVCTREAQNVFAR